MKNLTFSSNVPLSRLSSLSLRFQFYIYLWLVVVCSDMKKYKTLTGFRSEPTRYCTLSNVWTKALRKFDFFCFWQIITSFFLCLSCILYTVYLCVYNDNSQPPSATHIPALRASFYRISFFFLLIQIFFSACFRFYEFS